MSVIMLPGPENDGPDKPAGAAAGDDTASPKQTAGRRSSGKNSMLGITHNATLAPLGHVSFGRRPIGV